MAAEHISTIEHLIGERIQLSIELVQLRNRLMMPNPTSVRDMLYTTAERLVALLRHIDLSIEHLFDLVDFVLYESV